MESARPDEGRAAAPQQGDIPPVTEDATPPAGPGAEDPTRVPPDYVSPPEEGGEDVLPDLLDALPDDFWSPMTPEEKEEARQAAMEEIAAREAEEAASKEAAEYLSSRWEADRQEAMEELAAREGRTGQWQAGEDSSEGGEYIWVPGDEEGDASPQDPEEAPSPTLDPGGNWFFEEVGEAVEEVTTSLDGPGDENPAAIEEPLNITEDRTEITIVDGGEEGSPYDCSLVEEPVDFPDPTSDPDVIVDC